MILINIMNTKGFSQRLFFIVQVALNCKRFNLLNQVWHRAEKTKVTYCHPSNVLPHWSYKDTSEKDKSVICILKRFKNEAGNLVSIQAMRYVLEIPINNSLLHVYRHGVCMSKSDSEWVCMSERKRKNDKKITDYFNQNCRLLGSN